MNIDFDFQKGLEELEWMSTTNGRFFYSSIHQMSQPVEKPS